jgi:drug/metabolite transporter (DMT)-like permease
VTTLNPIMAYAVGIMLSCRLPSRNEAIGLILGIIAGSFLLKLWDNGNTIFESGNLYFLLAAFTWSVMSKITSKATQYGSSLGFSLWQYLITLIILLPLLDVHEFNAALQITDPYFWWNLFFSSAIVTALATTMYFYATTRFGC